MLFIRTAVRPSAIFGNGCFAAEPVRKGTIVCSFTTGARVITEAEYLDACRREDMPLMRTGTRYAGRYFTVGNDHEQYTFINHTGKTTLWRPEALKYWAEKKDLDGYGILFPTDKKPEQIWRGN